MNLTAIHCRNLTKVFVSHATLTRDFTNILHYNPNIQQLVCENVESKDYEMFEGLQLYNLQTLCINDYEAGALWHRGRDRFDEELWAELLVCCPNLRSLGWGKMEKVYMQECLLAKNASILTQLVNLSCSYNEAVNDAAMLTIAQTSTSLRTLNIQRCKAVTDLTLLHLAKYVGDKLEVL